MKVMLVTAKYYPDGAGAGRSVRMLAEGLVASGHEAIVVKLSKHKKKTIEEIDGVKVIALPLHNIYWPGEGSQPAYKRLFWHLIDDCNVVAAREVGKVLDEEKPDIVNTNIISGFGPAIFKAVKARNIKLVHTMRDYYMLCPQSAMFKNGTPCEGVCASCRPFAARRKGAAANVDLFLANSNFVLGRHIAHKMIAKDDHADVQFNMNEDDEIRVSKAPYIKNTMRFGFIGRVCKEKGIEEMLSAFSGVKNTSWSLTIAGLGDSSYIDLLKQKINKEQVEFVGFCEPSKFYGGIDCLICPSIYDEPLPRVIYEAYREGLPVIAARSGGIPEIVDHGENGLLYDPYDIWALQKNIEAIMNDAALHRRLGGGAEEKAKDFRRSVITESYIQKLQDLLSAGTADGRT